MVEKTARNINPIPRTGAVTRNPGSMGTRHTPIKLMIIPPTFNQLTFSPRSSQAASGVIRGMVLTMTAPVVDDTIVMP